MAGLWPTPSRYYHHLLSIFVKHPGRPSSPFLSPPIVLLGHRNELQDETHGNRAIPRASRNRVFALEYQRVIRFLFSIDPPRVSNWLLPSIDRSRETWKFSSVSPNLPYSRLVSVSICRTRCPIRSCTIMSFRAIGAFLSQHQYIANHAD